MTTGAGPIPGRLSAAGTAGFGEPAVSSATLARFRQTIPGPRSGPGIQNDGPKKDGTSGEERTGEERTGGAPWAANDLGHDAGSRVSLRDPGMTEDGGRPGRMIHHRRFTTDNAPNSAKAVDRIFAPFATGRLGRAPPIMPTR
jgi:hypothetical protein